ncbi:MAG: hydroxymethylglutaryl-CoA lyase, partial [Bacteroidetes bacterium 4572_77]
MSGTYSTHFFFVMVKIIETPRDAMQGINTFIPTAKKVAFLNTLLQIGFHTLDFGSFVSPKAIPQLKDTAQVVEQLDLSQTKTKLLAIIGNERGAKQASSFSQIKYLGYPYSISETFLKMNINSNFQKAFNQAEKIQNICQQNNKELVVYISNAFGNAYGDAWSPEIVFEHVKKLQQLEIKIIPLSDTVGVGNYESIFQSFQAVVHDFPQIEFGAHLHTKASNWQENLSAAWEAGCRRFDTVINGLGGCPMSGKKLIGNLHTRHFLQFLNSKNSHFHSVTPIIKS